MHFELGLYGRRGVLAMLLGGVAAMVPSAIAQGAAQQASVPNGGAVTAPHSDVAGARMPTAPGTELDRVVAIVNGDLILDSDVDEERRLEALEPYRDPGAKFIRERAIERLINRDLILQQARLQPGEQISDAEVGKQIDSLRKAIPACKRYNCETKAGWDRFLADNGFTEAAFDQRWKGRMEVLAFIEDRFRMGIKITPADIKNYYDDTLLPEYHRQNATPPPLDAISPRIQEVLLQRQVSGLLSDWLKSLRAQGGIVVLHPGEEAP
jgi:hypothetical protein